MCTEFVTDTPFNVEEIDYVFRKPKLMNFTVPNRIFPEYLRKGVKAVATWIRGDHGCCFGVKTSSNYPKWCIGQWFQFTKEHGGKDSVKMYTLREYFYLINFINDAGVPWTACT